jgi:hypothetical protein
VFFFLPVWFENQPPLVSSPIFGSRRQIH